MKQAIEVVAAVMEDLDGRFLLASRPQGKPYAGYWEFPGGKIEPGETAQIALERELTEELGVHGLVPYPWIHRRFDYPHARVIIHFYRVRSWEGIPRPLEGQDLRWVQLGGPYPAPMLPANDPVLTALALPQYYALTHFSDPLEPLSMDRFSLALDKGIRLILMREPEMNEGQRAQLFRRIQPFVKNKGGELLFHGMPRVARLVEADGIHLNSIELMRLASRPDFRICAASVHDAKQIEQAVRMNLDFIVLSPVMKTKSHPDKAPLGWPAFSRLIRDCPIPVFAMGGLQQVQLNEAMKSGAHGIAMQRAVWPLSHVCRNKNDSGELE